MHQTKSRAKRITFVVWITPCCIASPFLYPSEAFENTLHSEYGVIRRLTCFISLPEDFRRGYYTFLFVFIYVLPLSFIAGTCIKVARCLLKDIPAHRQGSIRRQEANRRKVAKMVMTVALAFAVSWTPYFLVSIVTQYQAENFMHNQNFFFTMLCINLLAFFNSCVNPFIYAIMSTHFRNGFLRFFRLICLMGIWKNDENDDGITNVSPSAPLSGAAEKHVRFRCQVPISCLTAHSSSDSSTHSDDIIQRTSYTEEKTKESFIKSFIKKRSKPKIIVQYVKRNSEILVSDALREDTRFHQNHLDKVIHKRIHFRKICSSADDLRLLEDKSDTASPTNCQRKSLSCFEINSKDLSI